METDAVCRAAVSERARRPNSVCMSQQRELQSLNTLELISRFWMLFALQIHILLACIAR
jgi:hypothetical protein